MRPTEDTDPSRPSPGRALVRGILLSLGVAAASLLLGALTSPAQGWLPAQLTSVANSAGGWTALALLLVWLSRARPLLAALLGVVSFVLLVEGYRIGSELRGLYYAEPFRDVFTYVGVVTGPVVGVSASLLRHGGRWWSSLAVVPPAAVWVGEGVYGLTVVAATTSPVYWVLQLLGGVALPAVVLVRRRPGARVVLVCVVGTLLGAAAFWGSYQAIPAVVVG